MPIFPTYINAGSVTNGGTVTVSTPLLNLTQTWNNVATTFTAALVNVTDTASAAGSLLMDLQVGGASKFSVVKSGTTNIAGDLLLLTNGANIKIGVSGDTILARDAANTLALRNGVNAQTFNVYNTYTDGSNYEGVSLQWASNVARLNTNSAGTGSVRALRLGTGNTAQWEITTSGHLVAVTDNANDIGASGANRPRNVFIAGAFSGVSLGVSSTIQSTGGSVQANTFLKSGAVLVSALPSAATAGAGARFFVTDATATTFNSIVAGGGANGVPVTSDATNWRIG